MDLDLSQIKSQLSKVTKNLGVLKNYSSLMIPAVIALVAVITFGVTPMLSGGLREEMKKKSVSIGQDARRLIETAVPMDQWKVEAGYQEAFAEDANGISNLLKQTTKRELISYSIFPEPTDTSRFIFDDFGRAFRDAMQNLHSSAAIQAGLTEVGLNREIDKILEQRGERSTNRRTTRSGNQTDVSTTIRNSLLKRNAETAFVYGDVESFGRYVFWGSNIQKERSQMVEECWYSQIAFWIYEDVVKTIEAMNTDFPNVVFAPLKRLMYVQFDADKSLGDIGDKPVYVTGGEQSKTKSFTGRASGTDMDVVHFRLKVVLNHNQVLPFMEELCSGKEHEFLGWDGQSESVTYKHNQITILNSKVQPVDRESPEHSLFYYGNDSIVELELVCEYIFKPEAYADVKPETLKAGVRGDNRNRSSNDYNYFY